MVDSVWLILSRNGVSDMRKSEPRELRVHQRAVRIQVYVPDSAFNRPPVPTASIDIPESALRLPAVDLDVTVNTPEVSPVRGPDHDTHADGTDTGTPSDTSSGAEPPGVR